MHIDNPARYPALAAGVLVAALALAVSLGLHLTAHQEGMTDAVITAAAGLVTGAFVRPFPVPVLTGFANALIVALVAYKVPHVTSGMTATVDGFLVALTALFVHTQGSPRLENQPARAV